MHKRFYGPFKIVVPTIATSEATSCCLSASAKTPANRDDFFNSAFVFFCFLFTFERAILFFFSRAILLASRLGSAFL